MGKLYTCNWVQALLNYIDFMFYNNNLSVIFKCQKEELPLNNIFLNIQSVI